MRDVQALVMAFYGLHVSEGFIHSVIAEAERRAAEFSRSVNLSSITVAALDELFSQGNPVLAGIDLDSDYVFLLKPLQKSQWRRLGCCLGGLQEEWTLATSGSERRGDRLGCRGEQSFSRGRAAG